MHILAEMSDFLTGTLDVEDAVLLALQTLLDYLGGTICVGLTTLENNGQALVSRGWRSADPAFTFAEVGTRINLMGVSASRWVIENGRFLHIPNFEAQNFQGEWSEKAVRAGIKSVLYVPLVTRLKPIGVLHVDAWLSERVFSLDEIQLCQTVANLVAAAIENGRLLMVERKQLLLAQTLQKVGSLMTTELSLAELYDQIFYLLAEVVAYDSVSIQLLGSKEKKARLVASKGFDLDTFAEETMETIAFHSLNKFETGQQISVISDTHNSDQWIRDLGNDNVRSWIGALLIVKGDVIGILNVDSFEANTYQSQDGDMVAAFANQAAIAIENTRLYKETDRKARELAILHQLALDTASVIDLDELFTRVTAVITATLYPENFGFLLVDEESQQVFPHPSYHGVPTEMIDGAIPLHESLSGLVIETGQPSLLNDVSKSARYMAANPDMCSEVMVPIKIDDEVIGAINVESEKMGAFSQNDLVFLTTLAGLMSASVARARLYRQLQMYSETLAEEISHQTAELKFERDRTVTILDNAGESILLLNSIAEIIYVNRAMEVQSGYSSEQLIGQTLIILESGLSDESSYSDLWGKLTRGEPWTGQLINQRADGSYYDVAMTMAPVFSPEGDVTSFVVVESDITRLKEIERLKTDFVANVTHELRTPLTNIKNYVTLAERGHEEKKARYFQILHHETDRLTQLIQDLLDLSHLETEAPLRYLEPVDLEPIIQEYVDIFQAKAEIKSISLQFVQSDGETAVSVEDRHLGQLLTNLVGNAIAYTPQGGEIVIRIGKTENDEQVWFEVADNGEGIPPEDLPHLFKRFYRGESVLQKRIPGTGLGLAICEEIVNRYQGEITVSSEVGKGTTVTVYLPLAKPRKGIDIL